MDERKTLSVPEAGARYFGLSRNGSYDAAARGDLVTIKVGRLLRVPVRAMEARLDAATKRAVVLNRKRQSAKR
jgi:hypothetical protein